MVYGNQSKEKSLFGIISAIVLFLAIIVFLSLSSGTDKKVDNFRFENAHYGFLIETPKNWSAYAKSIYSEENIPKLLDGCRDDASENAPPREIGRFRLQDQDYKQDLIEEKNFSSGLSTGAILDISINCLPDNMRSQVNNMSRFEGYVEFEGFGRTKNVTLFNNGLQYRINEYIYISPSDKSNEEAIRKNYFDIFNKIIASIQFIK